nr:transposase, MuDR [Tanacetum cinerariifolium]
TYNNLFSIKLHYGGMFTDSPNKEYVDGEICFVDMLDIDDFKVDILNSVMCSIGYKDDDELLLYYKIPLRSLDVGLKRVLDGEDETDFIDLIQPHVNVTEDDLE